MHCFVLTEDVLDNLVEDDLNVELLPGELYRNCINLKRQKDALEIAIKEADWAYGTKHGEERNKLCSDACDRIGEVLESMYDNAGRLFNYETNTFHYNVAIAYTRGADFMISKAERTFIRSLHVSSPDSNGSIDAPVCNSILLNYNMWGGTYCNWLR